jgi:ankyrin repeat protein
VKIKHLFLWLLVFAIVDTCGYEGYLYVKHTQAGDLLFDAVDRNNIQEAKQALSEGADINISDERLETPLAIASVSGEANMVELLLNRGATPNVADDEDYTPLMYACQISDDKIARLLLRHGANVAAKNVHGLTALDIAKAHNRMTLVFMENVAAEK